MKIEKKIEEQSTLDLLDQQYLETDNKEKLDYWAPLAKIIMESIALRDLNGLTQADLAKRMQTRQSVISRFENMGRLPSYDFFARLSLALGHVPGMTLYGDYMAVVPHEKQTWIKEQADSEKTTTQRFVQNLLDEHLTARSELKQSDMARFDDASSSLGDSPELSAARSERAWRVIKNPNYQVKQHSTTDSADSQGMQIAA